MFGRQIVDHPGGSILFLDLFISFPRNIRVKREEQIVQLPVAVSGSWFFLFVLIFYWFLQVIRSVFPVVFPHLFSFSNIF